LVGPLPTCYLVTHLGSLGTDGININKGQVYAGTCLLSEPPNQ
jgi:hypothetical protein